MASNSLADTLRPPHEAAAFALVGEFMWHWSLLESQLNTSVHRLCGLKSVDAYVVTSNMGVRDKINVVRTMLHFNNSTYAETVKAHNKLMDRIAGLSGDRNLVAHTHFSGVEKGVEFTVIKAKGKFDIPDLIWTPKDFADRNRQMVEAMGELRAATTVAAGLRVARAANLHARNLFAQPTPGLGLLGGLYHLGRQALEADGSPSPTPTSDPETLPAPKPKRKRPARRQS